MLRANLHAFRSDACFNSSNLTPTFAFILSNACPSFDPTICPFMIRNAATLLGFLLLGVVFVQPLSAQRDVSDKLWLFREAPADWTERSALLSRETLQPEDAVLLELNAQVLQLKRSEDLDSWSLTLPCPAASAGQEPQRLTFDLKRFYAHPAVLRVGVTNERGLEEHDYVPQLQSFTMNLNGETVGTLILMTDHVLGSFHHEGRQFDLAHVDGNAYAVLDFNKRSGLRPFECGFVENQLRNEGESQPEGLLRSSGGGGCVEIAIDVDYYTYSTYNNMANATDWALAQLAGVQAIYTQELNGLVFLTASYVHLWQSPDPMANYTNDAGGMLDSFRNTWETTASLDAVQRDVTHLMSKRNNTGTGGIAWLGVNCGSYAYGFSSAMSGSTNTNINSYSWNLDVVSHELGHNFGANHTHWCGWPGGAIDNCASAEGGCGNGPAVESGTIMSYCHVTSTPKVLQFHPTVEQNALIPSLSAAACYGACEGWTPPDCAITNIQGGVQQACDPLTLTYTQQVIVTHEYAPASGWLVVNGFQTAVGSSPQSVNLLNEPADGQPVNVTAYFSTEQGCALSKANAFTHRDPCCGQFRMTYIDPDANILRIRNEADCAGQLDDWGFLNPGGYTPITNLVSQGQNLVVNPGETVQISWASGLSYDWLMLFLPTDQAFDYVQWGPNAPANIYFLQYDELDEIWPGGGSVYVDALPPYEYIGTGGYGVDQWTGQDIACSITNFEVTQATPCDEATNTYDLTFQIDWVGTPDSGGLTVNGTSYSISGNSLTETITLPANGTWINLTATFDGESTCTAFLGNAYYGPGSCAVCPADINGNGAIEVSDVLMVLSEFGCASNCNPATDLDGDGAITVSDVLAVLSAFGEDC